MSERKVSGLERTEESLWQRSAAITASIDGMAILDRSGAYTYMNDAHAEIYGYDDPIELLGKTWEILYDEEQVRWIERHVMTALERDGHWRGEAIGRKRDGSRFPQEISLTTTEGGGFVCVVRDVTERKRAEEKIRELSHYNRTLFEANLAALVTLNPRGTITDVNRATEEITGFSRERLIGTAVFSYFEDPYTAREWFRRVLGEGAVRGYELEIRNSAGSTVPVSYNATVYRDEKGEVAGVLASARDIADRKQAEEKLREAERKYRALVERVPAVTYIQELEDPSDTVYVSPQIEEILGYTPEECTADPEHWTKILHPDDRERVLAEDRDTNRTGEPFSMEYRQIAKDGRVVWLRDEAVLVRNEEGEPLFWQGVKIDITERKRAEEALKESEELYRRQAQELGLLHEVRTALAQELELTTVFRTVVEAIARTYGYTLVSAYLLEGEELVLQHHVGYERVLERIPVIRGIMGRVIHTGQPVLLEDVREDPAFLGAIEGITSEVCVPLYDEGKVVGTLNVESAGGVRLTQDDLRLVSALGAHVSVAISRARLYTRVRRSEERFRSLVQNASDIITLYEADGTVSYVSPAIKRVLGYEPVERIGADSFELVHPDDVATVKSAFAEVLRRPGVPISVELRARHRDGSWRHI